MNLKNVSCCLLISVFLIGCSIEKRHYFSGFHLSKNHRSKKSNKTTVQNSSDSQVSDHVFTTNATRVEIIPNSIARENEKNDQEVPKDITRHESRILQHKYRKNPLECDHIICLNGDEIDAKVLEIGINEIKYKNCNNPDGPVIFIQKSSVLMIKYSNGTKDLISPINGKNNFSKNNEERKSNGQAIAGLILGILSILVPIVGFLFGVFGLILSIMALKKQLANPDEYKTSGKNLAIAGMVCSIIGILITIYAIYVISSSLP